MASSSKVVPVDSMGTSARQTVSIKAFWGWRSVLFGLGLVLIANNKTPFVC